MERIIRNLEKFNEFRFLSEVRQDDKKEFWDIVCSIVIFTLVN